RKGVLPLAAILGVLAELLEFMRQAHDEGLLLGALDPGAILVDGAQRVHYVGSDLVVANGAVGQTLPEWRRLFPPQRYAHGYAAPECFEGNVLPDRSADLYAWGSLAFALLTGERLERIAQEQEQSWALFQESHFARLKKTLESLPASHVHNWGEQVGVGGPALSADWPKNALTTFRLLLASNPAQRPASVAELRSWLVAPPPASVRAALALHTSAGQARLFLDLAGLDADAEIVIRRGWQTAPSIPADGQLVVEGPPRSPLADLLERGRSETGATFYSIFSKRWRHQAWSFSRPVT